MNPGVSSWIAQRLSLRSSASGSAGVVTAIAGVALALMILEFTLAIVVGFKNGIKERLAGFDAEISVVAAPAAHQSSVVVTPELIAVIEEAVPGAEIAPAMRTPGLIKTDDDFETVIFMARDAASDFTFERGNIVEGSWPDYSADSCRNDIVLSRATASAPGLNVGDKVYTTFFVDDAIKVRRNRIAGLFVSNFGEYDSTVAYASLDALQSVEGVDSLTVDRIDLRGLDFDSIAPVAERLQ